MAYYLTYSDPMMCQCLVNGVPVSSFPYELHHGDVITPTSDTAGQFKSVTINGTSYTTNVSLDIEGQDITISTGGFDTGPIWSVTFIDPSATQFNLNQIALIPPVTYSITCQAKSAIGHSTSSNTVNYFVNGPTIKSQLYDIPGYTLNGNSYMKLNNAPTSDNDWDYCTVLDGENNKYLIDKSGNYYSTLISPTSAPMPVYIWVNGTAEPGKAVLSWKDGSAGEGEAGSAEEQIMSNNIGYSNAKSLIFSSRTGGSIILGRCQTGAVHQATVTGLGSYDPSSVTFDVDTGLFNKITQVTKNGNIFIKIPKMYRKINTSTSVAITSFTMADAKIDSSYQIYPCFLAEDGVTELDYVLIGKYCSTSSSTINSVGGTPAKIVIDSGRSLCRALGTGYQQMDWMMLKLWQDLIIMKTQSINIHPAYTDGLGIYWNGYTWIDGLTMGGGYYNISYKPSYYTNNATSSTTSYTSVGYTYPTSTSNGSEIARLGYNSSNPFFNSCSAFASDTSYVTYYCCSLAIAGSGATASAPYPVSIYLGNSSLTSRGVFSLDNLVAWTATRSVRLCYRPL